jgi:glutathione-regulated potassium-efflux system ancillary protein KefF
MPRLMIAVLHAHPYPDRSRANRALARAVDDLPGVVVRSLYDLYPDFAIDVDAEQRVLAAAEVVVWQHPLFWYTAPALQKLWYEQVLRPAGRTARAATRSAASSACGS